MRQPQVAPLVAVAIGLIFFVPVAQSARTMVVAALFLAEFLSDGRIAPLTALTASPRREMLGPDVDQYVSATLRPRRPLVLVHGFTPAGRDDPRLQAAAMLLARAGFDVAVPTIPGLTRGRLRPEDAEPVATTIMTVSETSTNLVTVLGVSVGAGPALLAAADPRVRDRVAVVVTLGGYASAHELLRYFLTGEYAFGSARGRVVHDPEIVRSFIAVNDDVLDEPARRRLAARDPTLPAALLANPPPRLRTMLAALSPERVVDDVRARLVVIHGRADPAIPYTESLRLAAARPRRTTLTLLGSIGHVEGVSASDVVDLVTLWARLYDLLVVRN